MPRRTDIKSILIPGSGPIVIGQACEFDYSGTQACKALRKEGFRTILVNSNPATIMTDPDLSDATYIEPLTVDVVERIIEKEKPDAILPTVGGQTALNLTMELYDKGILAKHNIKVNAVAPGVIDTPLHSPEKHAFLATLNPLGRLGQVQQIVDAVLYLTDSDFTTGVVLPVDGGAAAGR